MYNRGDSSWKRQPKVMSNETIYFLAQRIKEHCMKHEIKKFNIIIHGGEPLLAGIHFLKNFVGTINNNLFPDVKAEYSLQTNGTLLDEDWCKAFDELSINVGISLDGIKEENDKYRIYHSGKGSYDDIVKGYNILKQSNYVTKKKPGFLSVININADPIDTYQHFKNLRAYTVDFLLPEANFVTPAPKHSNSLSQTPYADWMITIFDIWIKEDKETRMRIRTFEFLIELILGNNLDFEVFGNSHNDVLVIETDGSIEAVDALKICGEGFTKAGSNVKIHSFDEAIETPLAKTYVMAHKYLSSKCLACPINEVCGGGSLQTRYSKKNGFNNPSVYCKDLMKLITHIQNSIIDALPQHFIDNNMDRITYEEVMDIIEENMTEHSTSSYSTFISNF